MQYLLLLEKAGVIKACKSFNALILFFQIVMARAGMVKATENLEELEKKINCGQLGEVVIQAENELHLARNILAWKSWEPLQTEPEANQWKWPL